MFKHKQPQVANAMNNREMAEIEVRNQAEDIRPILVRMVELQRDLANLGRFLGNWWLSLPHYVRKTWAAYGALTQDATVFSGDDAGNHLYMMIMRLLTHFVLPYGHEIFGLNKETMGDLLEGALGYRWWLRYRGGMAQVDVQTFGEQLLRDCPDWEYRFEFLAPNTIEVMWDVWHRQLPLLRYGDLLEELCHHALNLMRLRPLLFQGSSANWADEFEELRTTL